MGNPQIRSTCLWWRVTMVDATRVHVFADCFTEIDGSIVFMTQFRADAEAQKHFKIVEGAGSTDFMARVAEFPAHRVREVVTEASDP